MSVSSHRRPRVVLVVWGLAVAVLGGLLMLRHGPLPVGAAEAAPPGLAGPTGWTAVHVLNGDCGCSRRVLDTLLEHAPMDGVEERIAWVGGEEPPWLALTVRARGYRYERLDADQLATRYGVEAAPLMLVVDPAGATAYRGGYSPRPRGPSYHDRDILARARAGEVPSPLPVFGCALSRRLKDQVDPLRL